MFEKVSKSVKYLIILIGIVLISSLAASLVQNSFGSVDVSRVSFETERGELAGYLFVPKGVDENNPVPAIVTTHGYLNNAEMQEITAIEMSRRGYVVLAFSMYDHGDSTWSGDSTPFAFWYQSVYDAVQYMYDQDIVLKDGDGNAMIGVSGHSMGGYSTQTAVVLDEMDYATNGYRKISVALSVGSDWRFVQSPTNIQLYGPRSGGMIAAQYDQFFFDSVGNDNGSVVHKDYLTDPDGLTFVGLAEGEVAEEGKFYAVGDGQRVLYTPLETHPQNTWSLKSGANTIDFYDEAFKFQLAKYDLGTLNSYDIETGNDGQVWWLKEAFTFVSLIALFAMIFPLFGVITDLPVFNKSIKEEDEVTVDLTNTQKTVKTRVVLLSTFYGFYMLTRFMDRSASLDNLVRVLNVLVVAAVIALAAIWIKQFITKGNEEGSIKRLLRFSETLGGIVVVGLIYRWFLNARAEIIQQDHYFSAPSVNTIVFWAVAAGGSILLISLLANLYFNYDQKDDNPLGLKGSPVQIGASILTGLALVVVLQLLVAVVGWVFNTDFRIYTYAIQIFNGHQFLAALRYMPVFFVYYLAAAISVYMNTKNCKGWKGDVFAALLLTAPIILFLIYQYFTLYGTGVAAYPTFSLSGILTVGLVPTLAISGIVMRRLSIKTGNIWASVVFTTVFFTLITLANTAVYILSAV